MFHSHSIVLLCLSRLGLAALDGSRYLWYTQPAVDWERGSLPIGNGRMGATIYGSLTERITINEDTIWDGPLQNRTPVNALSSLSKVRDLLVSGDITGGDSLCLSNMNQGNMGSERQFSYFGDLHLSFGHSGQTNGYQRWLDTKTGTSGVSYVYNGVNYTREYIANFPSDVLAARFQASTSGSLSLTANIDRLSNTLGNKAVMQNGVATLQYNGSSGQPAANNPILFSGQARFVAPGAKVSVSGSTVTISGATVIDMFFDAETNYRYSDPKALAAAIDSKLTSATTAGYEAIRTAAIDDASALLGRASIDLGQSPNGLADLPTDQRVQNARKNINDIQLVTLVWNLGRHMLVASSRNTKASIDFPANLQGVWNNKTSASWGGKFTININTEMNYWLSWSTNLLEVQQPLFDLMSLARTRGEQLAKDMYGCGGVVLHHNLDLWADPAPTDVFPSSSMWPMGAAWLVQHMIEHYRFTGDKQFLSNTAYPYLLDVASFYYCYTFKLNGYQVTGPSLSPENTFVVPSNMRNAGASQSVDVDISMDNQLMRAVMQGIIEAASELGISASDSHVTQAQQFLTSIRPAQIGSLGQILEWRSEYKENDVGHRHFSPLWSLFPGSEFTPLKNATLAAAAGVLVDRRINGGSGSTGWSRTWAINLYARLLRGDDAWKMVTAWFGRYPTPGLWNTDSGSNFQIDGNFGITSGITELFLQSHAGNVHLLPALPKALPTGSVTGLTARGGFVVDIAWKNNALTNATITSSLGSMLTLRAANGAAILVNGAAYQAPIQTQVGAKYVVTLK
ncbi:glycoside hydrolase family 95 protein [Xylariaceae sp. FL1651]|nr:glycoside hydrolase family 95 protein [Xylariaceae sp. FL1651]